MRQTLSRKLSDVDFLFQCRFLSRISLRTIKVCDVLIDSYDVIPLRMNNTFGKSYDTMDTMCQLYVSLNEDNNRQQHTTHNDGLAKNGLAKIGLAKVGPSPLNTLNTGPSTSLSLNIAGLRPAMFNQKGGWNPKGVVKASPAFGRQRVLTNTD